MAKMKKYKSIILNKCEINDCNETENLHLHHIIERTELNTNNHVFNLAILCSNCHGKIHSKAIKIIGLFPSTKQPNGRSLVYEVNGKKNIDIDTSYIKFENKSFNIGEK